MQVSSSQSTATLFETLASAAQSSAMTSAEADSTTVSTATSSSSTSAASSSSSATAPSAFAQQILKLYSALSSGTNRDAQAALDAATALLNSGDSTPDWSSASEASASTSSTSTDAAASMLANVGSALSNSDVSSAQSAIETYMQSLSGGSMINLSA